MLTGAQYEQFSKALREAFDAARLKQMLRLRLDKNLEDIIVGGGMEEIAFEVIKVAEGSVALAVGCLGGMTPTMRTTRASRQSIPPRSTFAGFRFPPDVIVVAVRWYRLFRIR